MRQQAEFFFLEEEQLRQALHLSKGKPGPGAGPGVSEPQLAATEEPDFERAPGDEDKMIQEALRRSVADTGAAAGGPAMDAGRKEEVWKELPPEALADGSKGSGAGTAAASEGEGVQGAGSADSPVCL